MTDDSLDFDLEDDEQLEATDPKAFYTALRLALTRLEAYQAELANQGALANEGYEDVA